MEIKRKKILEIILLIYTCLIYAFPNVIFGFEIIIIPILISFKPKIKLNFYMLRAMIFFIICSLCALNAIKIEISLLRNLQLLKLFILGYLFIINLNDREIIYKVLNYFIVAGIVLIVRVLTVFPISKLGVIRFQNIEYSFNANTIGINLGISLLFLFYSILSCKKGKLLKYILFFLFLIFIFLTGSKKALILVFLGVNLSVIMYSKNKMKLCISIILVILCSFILYFAIMKIDLFYKIIGYRLEILISTLSGKNSNDGSTLERIDMIKNGIDIIKNNFIKGWGLEQFAYLTKFGTYSHNNYIELFVSTGVFGILCYYSLYAYLFFKNIKYMRRVKILRVFFILLSIMCILDVGYVSYLDRVFQFYFVINYSVINVFLQRKNRIKMKI